MKIRKITYLSFIHTFIKMLCQILVFPFLKEAKISRGQDKTIKKTESNSYYT